MKLYNIPYYGILNEVDKKVEAALLDYCESAEFLSARIDGICNVKSLSATKYEDIVDAFISAEQIYDGDIRRSAFKFALTSELKAHIIEEGLHCIFTDGEDVLLEDLSLYRNGEKIYSCVSHEDIEELAESDDTVKIMEELKKVALEEMKKQPLYNEMYKIAQSLRGTSPKTIYKEWRILFDLNCYVDKAKKLWFYQCPEFSCSFKNFKAVAERYLTPATFSELKNIKSFADLQPIDGPTSTEQVQEYIDIGKNNYQYILSDYYNRVKTELLILKEILGIKNNSELFSIYVN